jgi:hypothetical protein
VAFLTDVEGETSYLINWLSHLLDGLNAREPRQIYIAADLVKRIQRELTTAKGA